MKFEPKIKELQEFLDDTLARAGNPCQQLLELLSGLDEDPSANREIQLCDLLKGYAGHRLPKHLDWFDLLENMEKLQEHYHFTSHEWMMFGSLVNCITQD